MKKILKKIKLIITIFVSISIIGCASNQKENYDDLISNKKISKQYETKDQCVLIADDEYQNIKTKIINQSGIMNVTHINEYLKISKNKDLILIYTYCKEVNSKYKYDIEIERNPNKYYLEDSVKKTKKSYAEETFGSVGQYVVIPFVVVGVIILSPFYVIQYMSK